MKKIALSLIIILSLHLYLSAQSNNKSNYQNLFHTVNDSILVVNAFVDPSSGPAVLKTTFSAQAQGGTGQGYTYLWDFDNSDGIQVDGFGQEVIYPFGHPGTYTVTLRAWDDDSNYGSKEITVQVETGDYSASSCIDIRNVSYPDNNPLIIEGLEISSADSTGIFMTNVENAIIRRNWIHNCTADYGAIFIDQCSKITIEENLLEDNLKGIFGACNNADILYNFIDRTSVDVTGNSSVYVAGHGLTNVLIEGNVISHTGPIEEYSNPDLPENVNLPIGIGGYNCTVRGNYVFNSMGTLMAHGDFGDQFYSEEIYIERNVVRNSFPWVEPGIAFWGVKRGIISNNYVDMAWREGIRSYGCQNVEISNNIILGQLFLVDSDQTSVHHNSIIYNPVEPPEELPHVAPPGSFGIYVYKVWPHELIQPEGNPSHSENLMITDNLVSGCRNSILAADIIGVWTDWNAISLWEPDSFYENQDVYLRVIDRSGSAVIGKNNIIAIPQFIDPDKGNYILRSNDPLASAGHNDSPVGVIWGDELPVAPDTAEIIPGISGDELILNGGAEDGVPGPWWVHTSETAEVQLEAINTIQFNGKTVTPLSGNYFFLLSGSVTAVDGWGMASAYQEWRPLQTDWVELDAGSAIFRLDGYYWSENEVSPPGIISAVEFYDDNSNLLYTTFGQGLELRATPSGYNRLTFYGQVSPLARQANVRIMASFSGYNGEYDFALAFDDVSLTILTNTSVGIIEKGSMTPRIFALHQNYPNPFNSQTSIAYDLPDLNRVCIKVYNILGEETATLVNGFQSYGHHSVAWNPQSVSSGVYFYRIVAGEFMETKKCIILK